METIEARVVQDADKHFIKIESEDGEIIIPMCEDKPNDVKSAFNKIIVRISKGMFQIRVVDVGQDLCGQVANEYITQLNREIHEVHGEMCQYRLLASEEDPEP